MKNQLLLVSLVLSVFALAFTFRSDTDTCTLEGKIIDAETLEGMIQAQVSIRKNGSHVRGTTTDFDGNYAITNIEEGTYDVQVSYLGYQTLLHKNVKLSSSKITRLDLKLSEASELLDCVVIKGYKAPANQQYNTTQGKTVVAKEEKGIFKKALSVFKRKGNPSSEMTAPKEGRSLPSKNINAIVATSAGLSNSDRTKRKGIKNAQENSGNYYVDGNRVNQSAPPASESDVYPDEKVFEEMEIPLHTDEQYGKIVENPFIDPIEDALSTFSIDVDRAGYSNMRRFIDNGTMPPVDAIRIEEMINYFDYSYDQPSGDDPISLTSTFTECPWNSEHQLLHIGLQGKEIDKEALPPSNLVFLIDVSGSMNSANKLPLLKSSFQMLINNLREEDRVAIVTYAGRAGVALESTSVKDKEKILQVVASLGAGGSTAGAEGIKTAYKIAQDNFINDGNNRVILATDGDFNVGINSVNDLEKLIEQKREGGVFLSVLGYGMGNYKDEKMQTLADKGNGNHAYIDNIQEARKVFVSEFSGTLFTIAKDVKLQIEFNPAHVQAYRLIGYENRMLAKEDFNDDTKDAGELGVGHVVTAIYEIVKTGSKSRFLGSVDKLKYQQLKETTRPIAHHTDELATIKFRYKQPDGMKSKMVVDVVSPNLASFKKCSDDLRFSVSVAQFGMLLRDSKYIHDGTLDEVIKVASNSKGIDEEGYRAEFVRLAKSVRELDSSLASIKE